MYLCQALVHHPSGASISTVRIHCISRKRLLGHGQVLQTSHSEFDWGMRYFEFVRGMLDYTSVHWQLWGSTYVCILLMGAQLLHSIIILLLVELTFVILLTVCFHTISEVCSLICI